jgi:hypothetical protein
MPLTSVVYQAYATPAIDYETGLVTTTGVSTTLDVLLEAFTLGEIDGVRIAQGDQRGVFPADALEAAPSLRDTLSIAGETWALRAIDPLMGGSLWRVQLRRIGDVDA